MIFNPQFSPSAGFIEHETNGERILIPLHEPPVEEEESEDEDDGGLS